MRIFAAGFTLGVLLLQQQHELQPQALWLSALASVLLMPMLRRAPPLSGPAPAAGRNALAPALMPLAILAWAMLAGFSWAAVMAQNRLEDALDPALEGRDIVVSGVVASLPQPFERGLRFEFEVESAQLPAALAGAQVPRHIQLAWYRAPEFDRSDRSDQSDVSADAAPLRAGERWRFTARLRRPHGSANPHGFDYEAWLLERGIRATGYVRPGPRARLDAFVPRPAYAVERLREAVRERFTRALTDAPYAGVLVALAIGDQRAISAADWEVFARTGVSHLMSISGLHVTMVSGLFAMLVMALWRRLAVPGIGPLALRLPAQKAAAAAGVLGAFAYCALSGFAVPAQRTLYMVALVGLALWLDRFTSASRVLALALVAVLLADPWAVLSPGFWLSFGAVALIFYVGTGRVATGHWLRQWGTVQWAVTVGLAPLLLALFGQVSLASPLANAIAIPVVSLAVTPLALVGAVLPPVPFSDLPLIGAHALFGWLMQLLTWLSRADGAVWQQHAPVAWSVPLALLGVLWLLAPRGFPARTLGLVLMLPLFAIAPAMPKANELWLTVLDVGQGLAVVARTERHALLYDTGPQWSPQADSGSRIVLPFLRSAGISRLDMLALSHEDKDHAGGAASVLGAMPVAQLVSSVLSERLPPGAVPYRLPCVAGNSWEWDGVRFAWLHPGAAMTPPLKRGSRTNESSCVLRIEAAGKAVLLTGDIEKGAERVLLASPGLRSADVLVVPHHGSGTSSTPDFVAAVSPRHAVFTVGYRNRFGHPKGEVWERYGASERHRSDRDGAVTFRISRDTVAVEREREAGRRYWYGR